MIGEQASVLRPFRHPRLWLGIWVFGWLLCAALSLSAPLPLPEAFSLSDKIGHVLAYATLAGWAAQLFARRRALASSLIALVALGIVLETLQGALTVTRLADPADAVANTLGVLLGGAIARTPAATLLLRIERRWHDSPR